MGTKAPDPAASLPALAAQVADLRGIVMHVRARVENAGSTSNLKLAEQVATLTRAMEQFTDDGPPAAVAAPAWHKLSSDELAAATTELADWVDDFLTPNYPHIPLRPCWRDHTAALWELSTLRAEWVRIYDRRNPELAGALTWHDRYLPGVAVRLDVILKDCKGKCSLVRVPVRALPQPQPRPRAG